MFDFVSTSDHTNLCGETEARVAGDLTDFEASAGAPVGAGLGAAHRVLQVLAELLQHVDVEGARGGVAGLVVGNRRHVVGAEGKHLWGRNGKNYTSVGQKSEKLHNYNHLI